MLTWAQWISRVVDLLLIDKCPIPRALIENKEGTLVETEIGMISGKIIVIRENQIIVGVSSDVEDFFLHREMLSRKRTINGS